MNALAPAIHGEAPDPLESYLERNHAGSLEHSSSELLAHLKGVRDLLRAWKAELHVVNAGLYHSVYGTETYQPRLIPLERRAEIAEVIGSQAEHLSYLFCAMKRDSFLALLDQPQTGFLHSRFDGQPFPVEQDHLSDLAQIWIANWLEQRDRIPLSMRASGDSMSRLAAKIVGGAAADAVALLRADRRARQKPPEILVFDGAVPPDLTRQLADLANRNIWRYGWRATASQTDYGFWHCHFGGGDDKSTEDCSGELAERPLVAPILALWTLISSNFAKGHIPVRVYANAHTFGAEGHVHVDSELDEYFTTIYYAHRQWKPNWAGETVFFDQDVTDLRSAVFPLPGRLVHFRGNIPHAARSPSRDCPGLRVVYVFKSRPGCFSSPPDPSRS